MKRLTDRINLALATLETVVALAMDKLDEPILQERADRAFETAREALIVIRQAAESI